MEIDRAHACCDVQSRARRFQPAGNRRSRAICADFGGAIWGAGERMGVIQVQEPGLFTTVQDLGREGFGAMGVSASGAADAISLRLGNRMVGNHEGAAGLEMTLLGGTFIFPEAALLALAGSDFGAGLDGETFGFWTAFESRPGQTLRLGRTG